MSQGFRKNNQGFDHTDTTGISPVQRGQEQRNVRRTQQITHLHQEFQDLKRKIREVENKNEKIIEKIHRAYNFKKKNAYTQEFIPQTNPVVHYDNRMEVYSGANMSLESRSDKNSDHQFKLQKRTSDLQSNRKTKKHQNLKINYSVQYDKNNEFIEDSENGSVDNYEHRQNYYPSSQMPPKAPGYHHSKQKNKSPSNASRKPKSTYSKYPPSPSPYQLPYQPTQEEKMIPQEQYEQRIRQLQQQLEEKQAKLFRLSTIQQKHKIQRKNFYTIVQDRFEEFFESNIMVKMQQLQKMHKKFEYKIKNLKRATLQARDRKEDRISNRLIEQGRKMRSNSRSRSRSKLHSPSKTKTSKVLDRDLDTSRRSNSQSGSRLNIEAKEQQNKEFQEIAQKYEELIKTKNDEIQKIQNKYKAKERQCYQLKMRIDLLQKKIEEETEKTLAQEKKEDHEIGSFGELPNVLKKASIESNLLDNLMESEAGELSEKLRKYEREFQDKDRKIRQLTEKLQKNQEKLKQVHKQYQQSQQKAKGKHKLQIQGLNKKLESIELEKTAKVQQIKELKAELANKDKEIMQKDCDTYSKDNKLKKIQLLLESKQKKIEELEKLITNPSSSQGGLNSSRQKDRSSLESSRKVYEEDNYKEVIVQLKEELQSLEEQLENNRNQVFSLSKTKDFYMKKAEELEGANSNQRKQIQLLQIQNEELKANMNLNNISAVQSECKSSVSQNLEHEKVDQQEGENSKYSQHKIRQLTKQKQQWFQKYQTTKSSLLEKDSKIIKLNTELTYCKKNATINEEKLEKIKKEVDALKNENRSLANNLAEKEQELEIEKQQNQAKISELEKQWVEFEDEMRRNSNEDQFGISDLKSENSISLLSYAQSKITGNTRTDHLHTQLQLLTVKLKQAQAQIQTQKIMQEKIMKQYRTGIEQSKKHLKEKSSELEVAKEDNQELLSKIQQLNLEIRTLHDQLSTNMNKESSSNQANNMRKYTQLIDRIEELEHELKQTKQINNKLTEMETQLFEEIKVKQEERVQLYEELKTKDIKISELEELLETFKQLKRQDGKPGHNTFSSHISNSSHKRQSLKSQSSLKYSAHSNNYSKMMRSSHKGDNDDKMIDLELSEAGSQFYDIDHPNEYQYNQQVSQFSNISDLFMKQQAPIEKVKKFKKRSDHLKLFQKTASYIKSLKAAISERDKRIKLLQKKIDSLKSSELVRKELGYVPESQDIQQALLASMDQFGNDIQVDDFKDYESVQLEYRKKGGASLRKYHQLEHDMKLVVEENKMLVQQIEALQQELLKAQEQENSLVKIKDLYKEEIKKLIKKNQQTTQKFQEEIKFEKKRVEESQSVHNLQTIKQLFIKMIQTIAPKFSEDTGAFGNAKKKEEKRKQMEQYVKVMSSILRFDKKLKDNLLGMLQSSR